MTINEAIAISKLPQEAQRKIVEAPSKKQRVKATADAMKRSRPKGTRGGDRENVKQSADAPGSAHVRTVMSRLEFITNEIERAGIGAVGYAEKFAAEFDWSDDLQVRRLGYVATAVEMVACLVPLGGRARASIK